MCALIKMSQKIQAELNQKTTLYESGGHSLIQI